MHHSQDDSQEYSVAPSPIVPTRRRPSPPPLSRRSRTSVTSASSKFQQQQRTIIYLAFGRLISQKRASSSSTREALNIANNMDFVRKISSNDSSGPVSTSTGAREAIIKRLRLLPQRPKKEDSGSKSDEEARQLSALRREGLLSRTSTKDRTETGSLRSKASKTKKNTDAEFKLDKQSPKVRHEPLSSLDMGDFSSLVEAAVSMSSGLNITTPLTHSTVTLTKVNGLPDESPVQQPRDPEQKSTSVDQANDQTQSPVRDSAKKSLSNGATEDDTFSLTALPQISQSPPAARPVIALARSESKRSGSETGHSSSAAATSTDIQQEVCSKVDDTALERKAATGNRVHQQKTTNHTSQTLKLFPDALPPRASSRTALRTPTSHLSSSNASSRVASPQPAMASLSAVAEAVCNRAQEISKDPSAGDCAQRPHSSLSGGPGQKSVTAGNLSYAHSQEDQASRRPASMQVGMGNRVPLPAPIKPLPSVPEPGTAISIDHNQSHQTPKSASRHQMHVSGHHPAFSLSPFNGSSLKAAHTNGRFVKAAHDTPFDRLRIDDHHEQPGQAKISNQSETLLLDRTRNNRENRVRALRMRDVSQSRLFLKDPDSPTRIERPLSDESPIIPRVSFQEQERQRQRKQKIEERDFAVNRHPSNGVEARSSTHAARSDPHGRLNGDSTSCRGEITSNGSMQSLMRQDDLTPAPSSPRSNDTMRSNSTRSASIRYGAIHDEPAHYSRSDSPSLESSDDEAVVPRPRASKSRRATDKHRKTKHPRKYGSAATSHAASSATRPAVSETSLPPTPRNGTFGGIERASPRSPYFHHTREPRNDHRPNIVPDAASNIQPLEARIADLERQNSALQAALLGVLGLNGAGRQGVDKPQGAALAAALMPASSSGTGHSFGPADHHSSADDSAPKKVRKPRKGKAHPLKNGWHRLEDQSVHNGYATSSSRDDRAHVRALEDMIDDLEIDWTSEQSSAEAVHN